MGQKVPVLDLNGRLRGVLGYREGIEVIEEGNLSEMSSGEESENEQNSDMELDIQEQKNLTACNCNTKFK